MSLRYGLGNSVAISTYVGSLGEIGVNTTTNTIHVFDGVTAGGTSLAKSSEVGGGGGGSSQTLNQTLILGNTSSLGMSVGVVTATYFVGDGSLITNVSTSSNSGYANIAGIATYATTSGISTYATTAGISTYSNFSGISTYAETAGIATYASTAGIATSVIGGIGSITQLNVSGVVTATSFSGSGINLTGIVTSIVAGTNISISGSTGQVTINSTATGGGTATASIDLLEVMLFS